MKIIMIEATAEELRANRTVMDSVNDALNAFAGALFRTTGSIDFAKAIAEAAEEESEEEEELE